MKIYKDPVFYFYLLLYVILYFSALNFNYVEGDDASTILYHLCGRDHQLQMPYAAYHSGFDFILSFLPTNEVTLREFSVFISFFFGFCFLYINRLFLTKILHLQPYSGLTFFIALPFLIPDFLFHSLLLNPTNIAASFAFASLIYFVKYIEDDNVSDLLLFIALFAIAIPFRWAIIMFTPVYLGVALFIKYQSIANYKDLLLLSTRTVLYVSGSVFIGIVFIYLTGYSFQDFFDVILWGKSYNEETDKSLLALIATASPFITPGLCLIVFLGLIQRIKKRLFFTSNDKFLFFLGVLSVIPFWAIGYYPSFKYNIILIPFILVFLFQCFRLLSENKNMYWLTLVGIALPWVVGIKLNVTGSAYGPGFEIKNSIHQIDTPINELDPDSRVKINGFSATIAGGFYMPTLEGPRPLYGYASTLLGREWYNQIEASFKERKMIFEKLRTSGHQLQYFQDRKYAVFQADLYRFGYHTREGFVKRSMIPSRIFQNMQDTILINVIPSDVDKSEWLVQHSSKSSTPILLRASYSSLISKIIHHTSNFELLGPYSIIIKKNQ